MSQVHLGFVIKIVGRLVGARKYYGDASRLRDLLQGDYAVKLQIVDLGTVEKPDVIAIGGNLYEEVQSES